MDIFKRILLGDDEKDLPFPTKTEIRIFLSSTFTG